jgi:Pyruvate/2-oxoacid:ferredoxin oxidoreductase delta subunit
MAVREVIEIDEELCDGCGDCVTACAEGALAIIDGKARLVSDVYCDGFGACLGECPQGAISIIRREAEAFDEEAVVQHLARQKGSVQSAAVGPALPMAGGLHASASCPGAQARAWEDAPSASDTPPTAPGGSSLRQWPIQLHLVPPTAPFFHDADVLLAADCVAYAVGGFHGNFLNGHGLAIACPKLDSHQEIYLQKLVAMIDDAKIRSLDVLVMEVPCCSGLVRLAQQAADQAQRSVSVRCRVIGVRGEIIADTTL